MSFPTIPDVNANINITNDNVIDLLLASIAFEELGLAHLINAEAEKIQYVLGTLEGQEVKDPTVDELVRVNGVVEKIMRGVIKKEMLLQFKLEDVIAFAGSTTTTTTTTSSTTSTTTTTTAYPG